ncbi:hypothetical protein H0H93_004550 [Arthromyces matolae]|nr:hypothetical protein H0H93_004550 [Arthromyces matolae]
MGAEAELDLPRITVIGNQSAGKSSVVEAISGIHVPRDAGTCTRCPIECRLNNSPGKWSCIISIRREYDRNGKILDKVSEKRFGEVIYQKDQVEPALRRAQMAVLNPHLNLDDFVRASDAEMASPRFNSKETFKFSADTICIDLEGPELTDLSFVDLPVKFVEAMVVNRIKGNSLILVALPMTDDIENQKAVQLARKEDPEGRRTIGVMTKPDMLTSGSTKAKDNWLDIIEGRKHHLAHGYYCTRQPDDLQRSDNITHAEARVCEAEFFSKNAPWSTSTVKDRFGTNHLISSLSKLLVGIINDTIYVDEIIQKHFDTCNRVIQPVLYAEGTPFTQNTHYLSDSIAKWSSKYKSKRSGHLEPNGLPQGETQTNGIIKATPPSSNATWPSGGSFYPPTTSFSFGASGTTNASLSQSAAPTPQAAPKTSSNAPAKGVDPLAAFRKGGGTAQAPAAPSSFHTPQTSSTAAKSADPLAAFRSGAGTPQPTSVTSPFPVAFPSPFSTDNTDGSNDKEQERQGHINSAIAALAALGFHGITEADFGKMIPPDEYETEIQVMAEVRGYFQVTYKRVIDTIPSLIDSLFVRAIADDMQSSLITKFSLGTADAKERCNMYLAENPMIIIRRKELVAQKHRLEEVKHALHSFGLS